jgi:hypothetical protein
VESRSAITKHVRCDIRCSSASWIKRSVVVSTLAVASSRIKIGGSFRSARAHNREPLLFAHAQFHSPLAHRAAQPFRQGEAYRLDLARFTRLAIERTQRNVHDSDGTVIITLGRKLTGGSRETAEHAEEIGKRHIHLSSAVRYDVAATLRAFVRMRALEVLNVAGSRESEEPEIYEFTRATLTRAFPKEQ